jgi:serine/threonine-protein kinase
LWIDRNGNEQPLPLEPGIFGYPRASPDGSQIALDVLGANRDIWIWDIARESLTRLTDGPNEDMLPLWSRDGSRVFFASARKGNFDIFSQAADGSSPARIELEDPRFHAPASFSADGSKLLLGEQFGDFAVLDLATSKLEPLLQSDAREWLIALSPDGRWVAYDSDESGQFEVWLRPFPEVSAARVKVSIEGGGYPLWDPVRSGELYYVAADGAMMSVVVNPGPPLSVSKPTKLFQYAAVAGLGAGGMPYDVARDGRFLTTRAATAGPPPPVTVSVVLNWFEELREQVPIAP